LLKNKKIAKKMGERGHKRVKRMFLWKTMTSKVEKLYKRLLSKKE